MSNIERSHWFFDAFQSYHYWEALLPRRISSVSRRCCSCSGCQQRFVQRIYLTKIIFIVELADRTIRWIDCSSHFALEALINTLTFDVGRWGFRCALCLLEPWSFLLACLRSIRMTTLVPDSPGVRQKSPQAGCILSKVQTRAVQWRSEKYFESRTLRTVLSWHDLYQDCIKPCWVGKKGKLSCCVRAPGPLASHCQRTAYVCNTVCFIYQYLFSIRLLVLQENK